MNGLQHLTIPTSLKFLSSIVLHLAPNPQIWPQLSPGWPKLFSFDERDGDYFFRARANPEYCLY